MSSKKKEQHILLIEEYNNFYSIRLEEARYSLGRHNQNSIVLSDEAVSRIHANLIRRPIPDTTLHSYEIVDGDTANRPSTNGVFINGQRCNSHILRRGDVIQLGANIKLSYFLVHMSVAELDELFPLDDISQPHWRTQQFSALDTLTDESGMRTEFLSAVEALSSVSKQA